MKEIWADISGYEGKYQVSTWGRVRGKSGVLATYQNEKGYLKVGLMSGKRCLKYRVNRLVAETFIPNYAHHSQVNHKDGNKQNNSVTNLEWVSQRRNLEHEKDFTDEMNYRIKVCKEVNMGCDELDDIDS